MEFNTQNNPPVSGPSQNPMVGGVDGGGKKTNPAILIVAAIAVLGLVAAAYVYMQGFWKDYYVPESMTNDYMMQDKTGGKMMDEEKAAATDAGSEIMLNKDTTSDIQGDLDQTMVEDVDKQFTDIDKDLQGL